MKKFLQLFIPVCVMFIGLFEMQLTAKTDLALIGFMMVALGMISFAFNLLEIESKLK